MRKIKINKGKKASVVDLILFLIGSFVVIMFFGLWIYGYNILTESLLTVPSTSSLNISDAVQNTFGQVRTAQTTGLHTLSYVMIVAMALSILISNFLVKSHPVFFIIYIFVTIGCIIASVYISNYYEDMMVDPTFGSTFSDFKGGSFIMLYLPVWITVVGLFGALFLFSGIMRDKEQGGSFQ